MVVIDLVPFEQLVQAVQLVMTSVQVVKVEFEFVLEVVKVLVFLVAIFQQSLQVPFSSLEVQSVGLLKLEVMLVVVAVLVQQSVVVAVVVVQAIVFLSVIFLSLHIFVEFH